jgi:hypothetical protein
MSAFRDFEQNIVRLLLAPHFGADTVDDIEQAAALVSYRHSGVGYFLTVRHPLVPVQRLVCSKPIVSGRSGAVECGFIAFIENGELMLECYSYGNESIPDDIRELNVAVRAT